MSSDYVNRGQGVFNRPGELFNEDAPTPVVRRFLQPVDRPDDAEAFPSAPVRPTVRSTFPTESPTKPPTRKIITGSFSTVRAARSVHQHAVSLWGEDYLPSYLGVSNVPDPSPEDLAQQYEDLKLFSYIPPSLMPTQDEFIQAATPSLRKGFLASHLVDMGVESPGGDRVLSAVAAESGPQKQYLLAPFTPTVRRGCADRLESLLGVHNG